PRPLRSQQLCTLNRRDRNNARGGIRMRHRIIECTGTHDYIFAAEGHSKTVETPGSRAIQVLAIYIIVRTMTGTLEANAFITERHSTPQVNTALIKRNPVRAILIFDK